MGFAVMRWVLGGVALGAALAAPLRAQRITPEALPAMRMPGFTFPESEATLTGWVTAMGRDTPAGALAAAKIYQHGWGLWAALTRETTQAVDGQPLRVFETWTALDDLVPDDVSLAATATSFGSGGARARRRTALRPVNPLRGSRAIAGIADAEPADDPDPINRVLGFVKFDPTAAAHVVQQRLFSSAALDALLDGGAQSIPAFPTTALVVKPVFQIVHAADLIDGRYAALKVWSGPPDTPQAYPPALWPGSVWIDTAGGGEGRGAFDSFTAVDGSSRTAATTYPVSTFIHYRLSAADAANLNGAQPGITSAAAGDYAILVAMHVAGREIARWTWQTFWWTPAPDVPPAPSTPAIARHRPAQLAGAPRHYAMALAYGLFGPDQPYTGGENFGAPIYAYNPWIEARFGPADLPDSQLLLDAAGRTIANDTGTRTNCLSCHIRSNYNPKLRATAPRFAGLRYTDVGDPQFVGTLQVDFLWSIARHVR